MLKASFLLKLSCAIIYVLIQACGSLKNDNSRDNSHPSFTVNKADKNFMVGPAKVLLKIGANDQAIFREEIVKDTNKITNSELAYKILNEEKAKIKASGKNIPITLFLFSKNKAGLYDAVLINESTGAFGEDHGISQEDFEKYAKSKLAPISYPYKKQLDEHGNFIKY